MNIIAIETSGRVGSVAVCKDNELLAERSFEKGMRHGRDLIPSLKAMFEELGWKPADTDLIAVSMGPGSYTGLRVGLTCAKTLANLLDAQVIGLPSLDVLAANVLSDTSVSTQGHKTQTGDAKTSTLDDQTTNAVHHNEHRFPICPIIDAKRKEVYACIYQVPNLSGKHVTNSLTDKLKKITDYLVITPEELVKMLPQGCLIFGDGVHSYNDIFNNADVVIGDGELEIGKARIVARLSYEAYMKGTRHDAASLTPMYLRRPQAEDIWEAKQKEIQSDSSGDLQSC